MPMDTTNLLSKLDIYGYQDQETYIIAALGARKQAVLLGDRGSGKTWAWRRLAQVIDRARKQKGNGTCKSAKVDAHTANEQDIVGFPYPPDDEAMRKAREAGEEIHMEWLLSQNTVANKNFLVLDEVTRIPRHMQNKYLGLLQERQVDGYELNSIEFVGGAANPLTYSSTEALDEALADRWEMIIGVPRFENMNREDRRKVIESQSRQITESEPDMSAAIEFYDLLQETNKAYSYMSENSQQGINKYVDNVCRSLNISLRGNDPKADGVVKLDVDNSTGHGVTTPLGSRRISYLYDNLLAVASYHKALGNRDVLQDTAKRVVNMTMVHTLQGDEEIPEEVLENVHDSFSDLLASKEARILSEIETQDDPADRVVMAIRYRTDPPVVTRFIKEAHKTFRDKNQYLEQHIFSYVLINRLQSAESSVLNRVDRSVYDRLYPDVKRLVKAGNQMDFLEKDVSPDMSHSGPFQRLAAEISMLQGHPRGRLILAGAAFSIENSDSDNQTDPMNPGDQSIQDLNRLKTSIQSVKNLVDDYTARFEDLSIKTFE